MEPYVGLFTQERRAAREREAELERLRRRSKAEPKVVSATKSGCTDQVRRPASRPA
jgi:hypothetical protein